jgi:hypothetical protein
MKTILVAILLCMATSAFAADYIEKTFIYQNQYQLELGATLVEREKFTQWLLDERKYGRIGFVVERTEVVVIDKCTLCKYPVLRVKSKDGKIDGWVSLEDVKTKNKY